MIDSDIPRWVWKLIRNANFDGGGDGGDASGGGQGDTSGGGDTGAGAMGMGDTSAAPDGSAPAGSATQGGGGLDVAGGPAQTGNPNSGDLGPGGTSAPGGGGNPGPLSAFGGGAPGPSAFGAADQGDLAQANSLSLAGPTISTSDLANDLGINDISTAGLIDSGANLSNALGINDIADAAQLDQQGGGGRGIDAGGLIATAPSATLSLDTGGAPLGLGGLTGGTGPLDSGAFGGGSNLGFTGGSNLSASINGGNLDNGFGGGFGTGPFGGPGPDPNAIGPVASTTPTVLTNSDLLNDQNEGGKFTGVPPVATTPGNITGLGGGGVLTGAGTGDVTGTVTTGDQGGGPGGTGGTSPGGLRGGIGGVIGGNPGTGQPGGILLDNGTVIAATNALNQAGVGAPTPDQVNLFAVLQGQAMQDIQNLGIDSSTPLFAQLVALLQQQIAAMIAGQSGGNTVPGTGIPNGDLFIGPHIGANGQITVGTAPGPGQIEPITNIGIF